MILQLGERLLPQPYGSLASTASHLLKSDSTISPTTLVDLAPVEEGLDRLRIQQSDLRGQVIEQGLSLKRIEERLELLREASEWNSQTQQALINEVKAVGGKMEAMKVAGRRQRLFALAALGLLAVGIALEVVLLMSFRRLGH